MAQENLALTAALNRLAELDHYNHWVYERISHAPGRRVLYGEFGCSSSNV